MTIKQTAKRMNCTGMTVRNHINMGRLAAFKIGRDFLIWESDLETFETGKDPVIKDHEKVITVQYAAEWLDRSIPRINQLIHLKRLPAEKIGRDFIIKLKDLYAFKLTKPTGRPKNANRIQNNSKNTSN